jgi:hypothetical protein
MVVSPSICTNSARHTILRAHKLRKISDLSVLGLRRESITASRARFCYLVERVAQVSAPPTLAFATNLQGMATRVMMAEFRICGEGVHAMPRGIGPVSAMARF